MPHLPLIPKALFQLLTSFQNLSEVQTLSLKYGIQEVIQLNIAWIIMLQQFPLLLKYTIQEQTKYQKSKYQTINLKIKILSNELDILYLLYNMYIYFIKHRKSFICMCRDTENSPENIQLHAPAVSLSPHVPFAKGIFAFYKIVSMIYSNEITIMDQPVT